MTEYASPACFLHELDPAWNGQLGLAETVALVEAVLTAGWPLPADLVAALASDRDRLATRIARATFQPPLSDPPDTRPPAQRLRANLSRIADDGLHARLTRVAALIPNEEETGAAP